MYYGSVSMFGLAASVIMIADTTYFSTAQLMYFSFTTTLIIPVILSLSRPSRKPTPYTPEGNFMCLHNHLIFWGNFLIPFLGLLGAYLFFYNTEEYEPNP